MNKQALDVVVVSTVRPDVLKITLDSFFNKLLYQFDVRLIVNVDPVGEVGSYSQEDVLQVCRHYCQDIVFRTPETPSFSEAVKWCWQQVQTPIFFHLEDDWCLKRNIDSTILSLFDNDKLISIRLNLTSNKKFDHDKQYVYCEGLSLNPSFLRTTYIKELLLAFDVSADPEKQFYKKWATKTYSSPLFIYYGKANDSSIVIDTGTRWRKAKAFKKWNFSNKKLMTWDDDNVSSSFRSWFLKSKCQFFMRHYASRYCDTLQWKSGRLYYK